MHIRANDRKWFDRGKKVPTVESHGGGEARLQNGREGEKMGVNLTHGGGTQK